MPIDPVSPIVLTAFAWVPRFAQGQVRDLRPRWALEELGLGYRENLIDALNPRGVDYRAHEQPWGQVPVLDDNGIKLFESGAILLHLGQRDARLLPADPQRRATALSWLFAAFNSVEPLMFELSTINIFAKGEEWAGLRRPSLEEAIGERLDALADRLGEDGYLGGGFTVADIAMATVLRILGDNPLLSERPKLSSYLARCLARPAFGRALDAQCAAFARNLPPAKGA